MMRTAISKTSAYSNDLKQLSAQEYFIAAKGARYIYIYIKGWFLTK
jgi:hypothetical protein